MAISTAVNEADFGKELITDYQCEECRGAVFSQKGSISIFSTIQAIASSQNQP
jgi:hypothetical protein